MPKGTIKLKKPLGQPTGNSKKRSTKRIELLPADVRDDIDRRLTEGEKIEDTVVALQEEWGECLDLSKLYLQKVLLAYRDGPLRARVVARGLGVTAGQSTAALAARVNAMTELEELCRVQQARLTKARATEAGMPLPMQMVASEIKLFANLLVRLGRLQLETGVLVRAPRHAAPGSETSADGTVPADTWDAAQARMLAELEEGTDA